MILEFLKQGKIDDAIKLLKAKPDVANYAKEYNENARDLRETQVGKRQDKKLANKTVKVAKIPIPFQRKVVRSASSFLFGSPVKITSDTDIQNITDAWDDLGIDTILLEFAEKVKSETEAAIVFFPVEKDKKVKLKARLLSNENGELLPYFDEFGDLVAFGWKYKAMYNGKETEFIRLFTAEKAYVIINDGGWKEATDLSKQNLFEKIPVVYHKQKQPEWWEVKELIDRFEMNYSKFADTNDYFASPKYKSKGAVGSVPDKDDTGSIIKLDIIETDKGNIINSDLDVISWDRAPEAIKLEFETGKNLIYGLTDTPDLTFDNVKGLGNVSGFALEMMFLGSIIKSKWDQGAYRKVINRCLSVIIAGLSKVTKESTGLNPEELRFEIEFTSVLPKNLAEVATSIENAYISKAISQQRMTEIHPLVSDPEQELERLKNESVQSLNQPYE